MPTAQTSLNKRKLGVLIFNFLKFSIQQYVIMDPPCKNTVFFFIDTNNVNCFIENKYFNSYSYFYNNTNKNYNLNKI